MENLRDAGIADIRIIIGNMMPEKVQELLEDGSRFGDSLDKRADREDLFGDSGIGVGWIRRYSCAPRGYLRVKRPPFAHSSQRTRFR